ARGKGSGDSEVQRVIRLFTLDIGGVSRRNERVPAGRVGRTDAINRKQTVSVHLQPACNLGKCATKVSSVHGNVNANDRVFICYVGYRVAEVWGGLEREHLYAVRDLNPCEGEGLRNIDTRNSSDDARTATPLVWRPYLGAKICARSTQRRRQGYGAAGRQKI